VAIDPNTGAIAAWLNGCDSPGPFRSKKFVLIYNLDLFAGMSGSHNITTSNPIFAWQVFQSTTDKPLNNACGTTPIFTTNMDGSSVTPFPGALGPFTAHGTKDCKYLGMKDRPGQLVCQGRFIQCEKFTDKVLNCRESVIMTPKVLCSW